VGLATALALLAGIAANLAHSVPHGSADPAAQGTTSPPRSAPPQVSSVPRAPLLPPPARQPIAGLRGFESRSRIEYSGQPGRLHELRAVYVFPERVRWWIAAQDGATQQRRMRYQYGQHVLAIELQQSESVEFRAEDRAAILAAFEMRRALFLWPDDRIWTGEGEAREAVLKNGDGLRAKVAGQPPRPVELEYVAANREFHDSFRAITWRTDAPRAWPATFEVWNGTTLAWRESVDAVDVETRFVDSFFVPPDRRGVAGTPVNDVRHLDIPPACIRRVELPADTTWDAARAERTRLQQAGSTAGAPPLEEISTFEVRPDGSPAAVILRQASTPARAPEGFVLLPDRVGVARSVRGLAAVTPESLKLLAAQLPAGTSAGSAYVRFDGRKPEPDVVVVVPVD